MESSDWVAQLPILSSLKSPFNDISFDGIGRAKAELM
jgi:hypothetical protein